MKTIKYTVVTNISQLEMKENVSELLSRGWKCQGGVAIENGTFYQSMIHVNYNK